MRYIKTNFKNILNENKEDKKNKEKSTDKEMPNQSFDQKPYIQSAIKWLKQKYGAQWNFVHSPKLDDPNKTITVSIDNKHFNIAGKRAETPGADTDVILFKILPIEEPDEIDNPFE